MIHEQANQSPTNSRQHVPLILTKISGTCSLLLVGQNEQANQSRTNSREHVPLILTKISGTCSLLLVGQNEQARLVVLTLYSLRTLLTQ